MITEKFAMQFERVKNSGSSGIYQPSAKAHGKFSPQAPSLILFLNSLVVAGVEFADAVQKRLLALCVAEEGAHLRFPARIIARQKSPFRFRLFLHYISPNMSFSHLMLTP